jgi:prepilin-type N-terminal cleavage/methylation domain-containing protein
MKRKKFFTITQFIGERAHGRGFTLIELLIVILILAILVAIAVPVFLSGGKQADHVVAINNLKAASSTVQAAYYGHIAQNGQGADAFRDYNPPSQLAGEMQNGYVPVDGRYMSIQEPRITWVNMTAGGGSALVASADPNFYVDAGSNGFQLVSVWKAGEELASGSDIANDWNLLNRKVGVVDNKYWDEATGEWIDNTTAQYITLVTYELVGIAHYDTIDLGNIVAGGDFAWNDGTGTPGQPPVAVVTPPAENPPANPPATNPEPPATEPQPPATSPEPPATEPQPPASNPTPPWDAPGFPPGPNLVSSIRIEPETLNLKSNGKFTAFISMIPGRDPSTLDPSTLTVFGAVAISAKSEGNGTLQLKFDRKDLENVPTGDHVMFLVTGKFLDGTPFQGWDYVRVID